MDNLLVLLLPLIPLALLLVWIKKQKRYKAMKLVDLRKRRDISNADFVTLVTNDKLSNEQRSDIAVIRKSIAMCIGIDETKLYPDDRMGDYGEMDISVLCDILDDNGLSEPVKLTMYDPGNYCSNSLADYIKIALGLSAK